MRISNISEFAGGADDIVAVQLVDGSAIKWQLTLTDAQQAPMDLSGFTFEFDTITGSGNVTPGARSAFTLANLSIDDGATASSRDSLVTVTDAAQGQVQLYLPADLYSGTVSFDTNTATPIVIGTLRYSDGATNQPVIRSIRTIIVMRYGVRAA